MNEMTPGVEASCDGLAGEVLAALAAIEQAAAARREPRATAIGAQSIATAGALVDLLATANTVHVLYAEAAPAAPAIRS